MIPTFTIRALSAGSPPVSSNGGRSAARAIVTGQRKHGKRIGAIKRAPMTVSITGNTWHVHSPCQRCGYGTRFKQFPIRCLCNRNCSKEELQKWHRFVRPELTDPAWQERIRQAKQRVAEWEQSQETQ